MAQICYKPFSLQLTLTQYSGESIKNMSFIFLMESHILNKAIGVHSYNNALKALTSFAGTAFRGPLA